MRTCERISERMEREREEQAVDYFFGLTGRSSSERFGSSSSRLFPRRESSPVLVGCFSARTVSSWFSWSIPSRMLLLSHSVPSIGRGGTGFSAAADAVVHLRAQGLDFGLAGRGLAGDAQAEPASAATRAILRRAHIPCTCSPRHRERRSASAHQDRTRARAEVRRRSVLEPQRSELLQSEWISSFLQEHLLVRRPA